MKSTRSLRLMLALLLLGGFAIAQKSLAAPPLGAPAPDFTLFDSAGHSHNLHDWHGRNVVLVWVDSLCPSYRRLLQQKAFAQLAKQYTNQQASILLISTEPFVPPTPTPAAPPAQPAPKPVPTPTTPPPAYVLTLHDPDGQAGRAFGATNYTETFVIDAKGQLAYYGAWDNDPHGSRHASDYENYAAAALDALIAGQMPKSQRTQPYGCRIEYSTLAHQ